MEPKLKKKLQTIFKIVVSLSLIAFVFSKLDWEHIKTVVFSIKLVYFIPAIFFLFISIFFSIIRFDLFIRKAGIRISFWNNVKLNFLGMFYNFFFPGGVGGDAYKIYLLNKTFKKPIKKIGQLVFIERFLGIVAIGFWGSLLILFLETPFSYKWNVLIFCLGILLTIIILRLVTHWFSIYKKRIYLGFFYSIWVQFAQLICVFFILKSLSIQTAFLAYLFMFLISSVLSVISFAGIGVRETVFYYGSTWFDFNQNISVSVALLFSLLTALVSFTGIFFLNNSLNSRK